MTLPTVSPTASARRKTVSPLCAPGRSWSDSTLQQQQEQLVERHAALLAGALHVSALHARQPRHGQQQIALRHAPPRAGTLHAGHCVRHNYSGTSGSPCYNTLCWTLARCAPVRYALCSHSARGQGLTQ